MARAFVRIAFALLAMAPMCCGQQVIDEIAARIERDIILLSDVRELSRYQKFLDGKPETDSKILDRLIDQWIVRNEATLAQFPQPSEEDVNRSLARLKRSFGSDEEFDQRRQQSGLSEVEIRKMLKSQTYLSNYLDSRFRPTIQIDEQAIKDYYEQFVIPRAEARGQTPPSLETARDFIQEALVQKAINVQAEKWLQESRPRVKIAILLPEDSK